MTFPRHPFQTVMSFAPPSILPHSMVGETLSTSMEISICPLVPGSEISPVSGKARRVSAGAHMASTRGIAASGQTCNRDSGISFSLSQRSKFISVVLPGQGQTTSFRRADIVPPEKTARHSRESGRDGRVLPSSAFCEYHETLHILLECFRRMVEK